MRHFVKRCKMRDVEERADERLELWAESIPCGCSTRETARGTETEAKGEGRDGEGEAEGEAGAEAAGGVEAEAEAEGAEGDI